MSEREHGKQVDTSAAAVLKMIERLRWIPWEKPSHDPLKEAAADMLEALLNERA